MNTSTNSSVRTNKFLYISLFLGAMLFAEVQTATAQTMMPLPPHNRTYTGSVRGYWFVAPVDFYMLGVRVPTDASSAAQSIHVMRLASTPPAYAGSTTNYTTLGYWGSVAGTNILPMNELIKAGDVIGILGYRGTSNSYSTTGAKISDILGSPVTLTRFLYQGSITSSPAGAVSQEAAYEISRVEMYYGPPCEIPDGNLEASLVDAGGQSQAYAEIPGNVWVKYRVSYPAGETDVTVNLDFYLVGGSSSSPEFSVQVNDTKQAGQDLIAQQMVSIPAGVPTGYYRVVPTFTSKNSCDEYQDTEIDELTFMLVNPGTQPCIVWPGDVNNDGLVNYGDRKGLTNYIHDANLNPVWLNGPARYRSDAASNPLTYLEWSAQAAVPWATPEGCYMDTDGNGTVNNFDFIAIKMNWMRAHDGGAGKAIGEAEINTFTVNQNFPNPFNPSTSISYNVPEESAVRIVVLDMLGREVATLVDGTVQEGTHSAVFDAAGMSSGAYMAVATMQGTESGMTFTKTIRMTLSK